ncbi:MAG TPA: MaoC family dehydratase [Azospirillaceae bacterium]|nr:MaoC family dehydratase [Azospirillaceae bacterium]
MTVIRGIEGARALAGQEMDVGAWMAVDQSRIDRFADATGDHQWIHVDREKAARSPFGGTIAHGYLTLALIVPLMAESVRFEGVSAVLNYGANKVRFPAPVREGARVRLHCRLLSVEEREGGALLTFANTIEIEGGPRPACVAESLVLLLP